MPCYQCPSTDIVGACTYMGCDHRFCVNHGGPCPVCGGLFCTPHSRDHQNTSPACHPDAAPPLTAPSILAPPPSATSSSSSSSAASAPPGDADRTPGPIEQLLSPYYAAEVCPSCGNRYDAVKQAEWARIVTEAELDAAYDKAMTQVCSERGLDKGLIDAELAPNAGGERKVPESPNPQAAAQAAAARHKLAADAASAQQAAKVLAPALVVRLDLEEVDRRFGAQGVQSVDAHNVIGQNAVKTSSSRREDLNPGTHSILQAFYLGNHDCKGETSCAWRPQTLVDFIGTGVVMTAAYCQKGKGTQCKVCESAQGEWHLLQRGIFFLDHRGAVPLEFIGLQWCQAFCAGRSQDLRAYILDNPSGFITFLTHCTRLQIDSNLADLEKLLKQTPKPPPGGVARGAQVAGSTSSTITAEATGCPEVKKLILSKWPDFQAFYRERFLALCQDRPRHPIDLQVVTSTFATIAPPKIVWAQNLYAARRDRPSSVAQAGFVEVPAGPAHKILVAAGFASSRKEAETALGVANKVTVDGAPIGAAYQFVKGNRFTVVVRTRKGDVSKVLQIT